MKKLIIASLLTLGMSSGALAHSMESSQSYVLSAESKSPVKTEMNTSCLKTSGEKMLNAECGDMIEQPVVQVAEPKYVTKTINESFSHETLFAFNKSDLSEKGKQALDTFMSQLDLNDKRVTVELINVIGYTDELGSEQYNLKLSKKRAETVASYLLSTYQLNSNIIEADGVGEKAATMGDVCRAELKLGNKPLKATPKVIECLAPDRKVDMMIRFRVQEQVLEK